MISFAIRIVENGFLLTIKRGNVVKHHIYQEHQRVRMFAHISEIMGKEPDDPEN